MIGGLGLVTLLRPLQVGRRTVELERRRPPDEPREERGGEGEEEVGE